MTASRTAAETVCDILCRTMPTTAAASGLCSLVDLSPAVRLLWDRHAEAKLATRTPDDLGLTALTAWLESRGEVACRTVVKLFRAELQRESLRRAVAGGAGAVVHVRSA